MNIFAKSALVGSTWATNTRLTLQDGTIAAIVPATKPLSGDICVDTLLPALGNLHSHSFQRAMAGMTEVRAAGQESFWTWRKLMYAFLERLTPDHVEAIAALTFMEMLEAGYASVGEFHYLHHQPNGAPYDAPAELSQRIFAATEATGIGLTHLPVLYSYGGVHQEPLAGGQLRFGNELEAYLALHEHCRAGLTHLLGDARLGIAPHSLRATSPHDLAQVLAAAPDGPVHIHIAEQTKEVEEVRNAWGQRPVEWLLDHAEVDARWCLIHATHMTETETARVAKSGAVAGLCPITESNLGDGIFNGEAFVRDGGMFGVGSDSNVRISLTEELRTLEYSQRLRDRSRNVMIDDPGSIGQFLYCGAARGGARALDRNAGEIAVGRLADLTALNRDTAALCALRDDQVLDGLCFAAGDDVVTDVWSAGRHVVQGGRHIARETILPRFKAAMKSLVSD